MKRSQLPLNAIRVFSVAARHLSFKKTAKELHITPSAVSQQIRSLEDYLGIILFQRKNRRLFLTAHAKEAQKYIEQGFENFERAVALLQHLDTDNQLKISLSPSFASKWLIPRLEVYYNLHPEVTVKISASMNLVNFDEEDFDLAIRYGPGGYSGLYSEKLLQETVIPVCSPSLINRERPLTSLKNLENFILIHDDSSLEDESCPDWTMWLKAACIALQDGHKALHFNQSNLAIEAAIAGRGIALAKAALAETDIASERLVRPFKESHPVEFAYYVVCPKEKSKLGKVKDFINWLRQEAGKNKAL